ncbi:MAG TPA: FtsX-like permease family protein [Oligoflexia bacterium]|nr:FtsX-like permease family protein [Oligoflexia bacterium]HMP47070.1 FtsX-like permease family protein [Oligoflexia bacterium]
MVKAFPFESFMALRYLRSKRKEVFISIITVISLLGVAVSVMVLNVVLAVMTGFEEELQSKLIDANAHITLRHYQGGLSDYQGIGKRIAELPSVESVFPYTYSQAMIRNEQGARGILIRGIDESDEPVTKLKKIMKNPENIRRLFERGEVEVDRPDGSRDSAFLPTLIIGEELQRRMGLFPGSVITLLAPELSSSPLGLMPRHRRFLVADIYSSGLIEYESGLAYISIKEAQEFFGLNDTVTGIEIMVRDRNSTQPVMSSITTLLQDSHDGFYLSDWTDQNRPLWEAIQLEKRVYFIVLLLLILIASFSIVATLVMVVMEKGRDIAILKTMGARDRQILKIFLIQGSVIGVGGVIMGTLLGYLGCLLLKQYGFPIDARVFSIDTVPVYMRISNFMLVAGAGVVITSLAGLYPAFRASKLSPAEALRFE